MPDEKHSNELKRLLRQAGQITRQWIPTAQQALAIESPADELLYGGQAGGGKTDLLLAVATDLHYRSIIFRRLQKNQDSLARRSREVIAPRLRYGARYNQIKGLWYAVPQNHPTLGLRRVGIELGSMQYERNKEQWQGRDHDFLGFDELTQFTESQYMYVQAWLRTTIEGQRTRIIAATNPPAWAEGLWVKKRWGPWLDKTNPLHGRVDAGELVWYATVDGADTVVGGPEPVRSGGAMVYPKSRTFIPAALSDNPHLTKDPGYYAVLQSLPEPLRSQLLEGDWDAGQEDDARQVIPTAWILAAVERWKERQDDEHGELTALGLDVARGGRDQTVFAPRHGDFIDELSKYPGAETPDGPSVVALSARWLSTGSAEAHVDAIGIGSSVVDLLRNQIGMRVRAINFGAGSSMKDKSGMYTMRNVRAAAYWNARNLLDPTYDPTLCLPDDPDLIADLAAPRFDAKTGKITLEPKAKIAGRIGRSPDCGDAVALALYEGRGVGFLEFLESEHGEEMELVHGDDEAVVDEG